MDERDRRAQRELTKNTVLLTIMGTLTGILERTVVEDGSAFLVFLTNLYLGAALFMAFLGYIHKYAIKRKEEQKSNSK